MFLSPDSSMILVRKLGSTHVYYLYNDSVELIGKFNPYGGLIGWLPDSKFFIYFIEKDDGHRILGSDYYLASYDCRETWQLTSTKNISEGRGRIIGNKLIFQDLANYYNYIYDINKLPEVISE